MCLLLSSPAIEYRRSSRKIVFTNGCFDLLHVGHVTMLEEASKFGDVLFVAINSDASVRRLKGEQRPVIPEQDRARMLSALACVDHILIFDEPTPHSLLQAIRPNVLVKGGTTTECLGEIGTLPGTFSTQLFASAATDMIESVLKLVFAELVQAVHGVILTTTTCLNRQQGIS